MTPFVIRMPTGVRLTEEQFFAFCQNNRDWRIERTAEGAVVLMPPVGGETSTRNLDLSAPLRAWARRDRTASAFDSSAGFILPNGATRSPDAAWVSKTRLARLTRVCGARCASTLTTGRGWGG